MSSDSVFYVFQMLVDQRMHLDLHRMHLSEPSLRAISFVPFLGTFPNSPRGCSACPQIFRFVHRSMVMSLMTAAAEEVMMLAVALV